MFEQGVSAPTASRVSSRELRRACFGRAEDREDLRMFEQGVSAPTASHAAWAAAATSLQMRNALPQEVRLPAALVCAPPWTPHTAPHSGS
jgi:hypothetical protein